MKFTVINSFILSVSWTFLFTIKIVFSGTLKRPATRCSSQCYRRTCDKTNGVCDEGCSLGYQPPLCKTICKKGFYGRNCSQQCPNRCSSRGCDFTTGFCINRFNQSENRHMESHSDTSDYIVPTIVSMLILIVAALFGIYAAWRLRKRQKLSEARLLQPNTEAGDGAEDVSHLELQPIVSADYGEYTQVKTSRAKSGRQSISSTDHSITLNQLESYVDSFQKDFLYKEFKLIANNEKATTEHGLSASNKKKNRYTNIYPYDHTRVQLKDSDDGNDYINASYIRGVDEDIAFITSQGPTGATVNDFIRMLWEQDVDVVIMLTNLIEESKYRCERYWPDKEGDLFSPINVILLSTQTFTDLTIRKLKLEKDNESHEVVQYQFTSWPDKGIPDSPWALVDFQQRISSVAIKTLPVVHCSAGVGRSGTYIALQNILSEAIDTGTLDFFNSVKRLREDRINMVQTKEQYEFLHIAAYVALLCRKSLTATSKTQDNVNWSLLESTHLKKEIDLEFKVLGKICEKINLETQRSDIQQSKGKTISLCTSPKHIPYLRSECHDGIISLDAVLIPGLHYKNQHILTELPKPNAVKYFWRLILQYNVALIIAFEVNEAENDSSIGRYQPFSSEQSLQCSTYKIQSETVCYSELWEEQTMDIYNEKTKSPLHHSVVHLKVKTSVFSAENFIPVLKQARSHKLLENEKILYVCRNGSYYSGFACALNMLLDRLINGFDLSVPLVVGTIKSIRPPTFATVEDYKMLYEAVKGYTMSEAK